ncbi:MAG: ATP-dependent DNA helicase [Saprospiraceae bacterium]
MKYSSEALSNAIRLLNQEQLKAVEQTEGPVLVIAGPGTGKTQILGARVGYILENTDTEPRNILCLTFTEAGAAAMRQRLASFIGPAAYDVRIFTFHGYCNRIIQENAEYFSDEKALQSADDIEKSEILREVINRIPKDSILKRWTGNIYFDLRNLDSFFQQMRKEAWTPEFIKSIVSQYLEKFKEDESNYYKRSGAGFQKGDFKQSAFDTLQRKFRRTTDAAELAPLYDAVKLEQGFYDYEDMILWVRDAFKNNAAILAEQQEQFHYILVDEYQDTNGAQNQLLDLLISGQESPNIFVVGDDDQSIYRFQGANVQNILDFNNQFSKIIQLVVLLNNYRSTKHIVESAKKLISHGQERLSNMIDSIDKNVRAAGRNMELEGKVQIRSYLNQIHEEAGLFVELQHLHNIGYNLSDVAVIYRKNKHAERIVQALASADIPYTIRREINALNEPIAKRIIELLKLIDSIYRNEAPTDWAFIPVLYLEAFAADPMDIQRILWQRTVDYKEGINNLPIYLQIGDRNWLDKAGVNAEPFLKIASVISSLLKVRAEKTVQVLFEKIIVLSGLLPQAIGQDSWTLQIITTLFDSIKNITEKKPHSEVSDILNHWQILQEESIGLPVQQVFGAQNAVNFITAHSSKGLEFKKVFVLYCTKDSWEKKGAPTGFSLPPLLDTVDDKPSEKEEERRLFFVAITRAEQELVCSYHIEKLNGKPEEPTRFIEEMKADNHFEINAVPIQLPVATVEDFVKRLYYEPVRIEMELLDHFKIDRVLEHFHLNVTALSKFLRCPLSFYFENILRIPSARTASAGYGSAIHESLNSLFAHWNKTKKLDYNVLWSAFEKSMMKFRSHFTDEEFARYMDLSKLNMPKYLAARIEEWKRPEIVLSEVPIKQAALGEIPLSGTLDKLELIDGMWKVTDYKTGNAKYALEHAKRPNAKNINGGDYWRQVVFYSILMREDSKSPRKMDIGVMDFIMPDEEGVFAQTIFDISTEEIQIVEEQIRDTWSKIKAHDMARGCNDKDCNWCKFVKNRKLYKADLPENALYLPGDEEED